MQSLRVIVANIVHIFWESTGAEADSDSVSIRWSETRYKTQSQLKMDVPYILGRAIMRGDLERVRDLIKEQPELLRQAFVVK